MGKILAKALCVLGVGLSLSHAITSYSLGALATDTLWTPGMDNPVQLVGGSYYTGGPYPFVSGGSFDSSRTRRLSGDSVFNASFSVIPGLGDNGITWTGGGLTFVLADLNNVNQAVNISSLGGLCLSYEASSSGTVRIGANDWPDDISTSLKATSAPSTIFMPYTGFILNSSSNSYRAGILASAKKIQIRLPDVRGSYELKLYGLGFASTSSACQSMFSPKVSPSLPSKVLWAPNNSIYGQAAGQVVSVDGVKEGGWWHGVGDVKDTSSPGMSYTLPLNGSLNDSIASRRYLKGEMHLRPGSRNPWTMFRFFWNEDMEALDISGQQGVCVTYASSAPVELQLYGEYAGYDLYGRTLAATTSWKTVDIAFSSMSQEGWGASLSLSSVLAGQVSGLRFDAGPGTDEVPQDIVINVAQVGWYGQCSAGAATGLQMDLKSSVESPVLAWSPQDHGSVFHQARDAVGGGYWYTYKDSSSLGKSSVLPLNTSDGSSTASYFEKTGSAAVAMRLGSANASAYGALALDFTPNRSKSFDATAQESVCIAYRSARPFRMNFYQANEKGYDRYGIQVDSSASFKVLRVSYASLAREGWDEANSYPFDPSRLTGVIFRYDAAQMPSPSEKDFSNTIEINQFGFGDACDLSTQPQRHGFIDPLLVYDAASAQGTSGYSNKAGTSGWWYSFRDTLGTTATPLEFSETLVDSARIVPFSARLAASEKAYAGVGFNWEETEEKAMDLSGHKSLCVTYRSTAPFDAYLNQAYSSNDNQYFYTLPAQTTFQARNIPFTAFKQGEGWGYAQVLDLSRQKAISFQRRGVANGSGTLEIAQVGFDGACEDQNIAPVLVGGIVGSQKVGFHGAALSVDEDSTLAIPKSFFADYEGDAIALSLSAHDSVNAVPGANGGLIIAPGKNIYTEGSPLELTVMATDDQGNVTSWPLALTVNPVNDAPVLISKADSLDLQEEGSVKLDVNGLFSDVDGNSLSYTLEGGNGKIGIDGLSVSGAKDTTGLALLTLTATDELGAKNSQSIVVRIVAVNDAPELDKPLPDLELVQDFGLMQVYVGDLFKDPDNMSLAYTAKSLQGLVNMAVVGDTLYISSSTGKSGADIITVTASDSASQASLTFLLTLKATEGVRTRMVVPSHSWEALIGVSHGFAELFNIHGRKVGLLALPCSESAVLQGVRAAGGYAVLRIGSHSFGLRAPE